MKNTILSLVVAFMCANAVFANSAPVVTDVIALQRNDNTGIIDIYYTLGDAENGICSIYVQFSINDGMTWQEGTSSFSGDIGDDVAPGSRVIVWDSTVDLNGLYEKTKIKIIADNRRLPEDPIGITWVHIPNDPGIPENGNLGGFSGYMSKYLVTNAQYCQFLNEALISGDVRINNNRVYGNGGEYDGKLYFQPYAHNVAPEIIFSSETNTFSVTNRDGIDMSDFPVIKISWYGAKAFCDYYGWRLPSHMEWRAVADYDGSFIYGCGTTISASLANYDNNKNFGFSKVPFTTPVGYYGSFGHDMADMAGNVWECTSTPVYDGYIIVGGSWMHPAEYCDVKIAAYAGGPEATGISLGFRVCHSTTIERGVSNSFIFDNRIRHTVIFEVGDDGFIASGNLVQSVIEGESAIPPTILAKPGLIQTGWDNSFENVTEDRVIVAQYEPEQYFKVTFEAGEYGYIDGVSIQFVRKYGSAQAPVVTVNSGWIHTGWDESFDNITEDITVFALYEAEQYFTITFNAGVSGLFDDGSSSKDMSLPKNHAIHAPNVIPDEGWMHIGWLEGETFWGKWGLIGKAATHDTTFIAQYELAQYFTVNFDIGDHGFVADGNLVQTVLENDWPVAPIIISDEGWIFTGWVPELKPITEATVFIAQYEPAQYFTVTFDVAEHGSVTDGNIVQTVLKNEGADAPRVDVDDGWFFVGWDVDFTDVVSDLLVKASYIKKLSGEGTESNPYKVSNINDLDVICYSLNSYYVLLNDLDFSVSAPEKIYTSPVIKGIFGGGFDGSGKKIIGLKIYSNDCSVGLFEHVTGTVRKLGIVDCYITGGFSTGAIAGKNNGTIESCFSTGEVRSVFGGLQKHCHDIEDSNIGGRIAGGLVGFNSSSYYEGEGKLIDSYSKCIIKSDTYAGGLVGFNDSTIANCYSSGEISVYSYTSGLTGKNRGSISNSFLDIETTMLSDDEIDPLESIGVISLLSTEMQETDRFVEAGWDFFGETINGVQDIWAMALAGYPVLKWQDDVSIVMPTYTVTFDVGNHGTITSGQSVQTVTYGEEPIPPTVSANTGWRFFGWGRVNWVITSDFTFKAEYIYIDSPGDGDPGDGDPGDGDPGDGDPGDDDPGDSDPGDGDPGDGDPGDGDPATEKEMDGNGTPSNPYVIRNVAHLLKVNENLSAHYILANNIYINHHIFTQALIAADNIDNLNDIFIEEPFTGRLNGQGYVIDRLIIRNNNSYNGLFGKIGFGGVVENLGLTDTDIYGNNFSGAITGYNNGTIRNCFSTGSIHGQSAVGGLVGQNHYGVIVNCYSQASITGFSQAGGLVGSNNGGISKCYSIGQIMSYYHHGGLIGDNNGSVQSSFWNIQSSGLDSSTGGIGLTDFQMQHQDNFTDWDFSYHGSWKMSDARGRFGGYPILMWQNNMFSPQISKVEANQRTDGSGIVEISYILNDSYGEQHKTSIMLSKDDGDSWENAPESISGDIGNDISPGHKFILWNSMFDLPGEHGDKYKIKVTVNDGSLQEYSNTFNIDNRYSDVSILDISSNNFSTVRHAYFLDNVSLEQSIDIKVLWADKIPSQIKWYRGENVIAIDYINDDTISRNFNVGKDFDAGENLFIEAISVGGDKSRKVRANFDVIPTPPGIPTAMLSFRNNKYSSSDFNIELLNLTKDNRSSDKNNKLSDIASISWSPNLPIVAEIDLYGYTEIKRKDGAFKIEDLKVAGMDVDGSFHVVMKFEYFNGRWRLGGGFHMDAYGSYSAPPTYVVFMAGPVPIPTYYRFSIDAYGTANAQFSSGSAINPIFSGDIQIGGEVEGAAGVGISGFVSAEGYLRGGLNFDFQVPDQPYLKDWYLTLDGGIRIVLFLYNYENNFLSYRWPKAQEPMAFTMNAISMYDFEPIGREYLNRDYAKWHDDSEMIRPMNFYPMETVNFETTLQSDVFGQSNAKLAVSGNTKCLVWLYDEPSRMNDLDRTKLVYSINCGSGWSVPEAINDTGRADLSPALAVDAEGNFVVTWANASRLISEGTPLNEFMDSLDIRVAIYDVIADSWASEMIASGAGANFNPKIASDSKGEITVVWTYDADSDILGENPPVTNTLLARTKTAFGWQDVQSLDTINGIITYTDVEIDQGAIHVVYSVDTDSDMATDADNELFYLKKVDGIWSLPLQLTNDEVANVNPQFVNTSSGLMLLWARDGMIVSATDFMGMTDMMDVVSRQGSSGQRGFTSAVSPTDNISVIWNDTSSGGSDLFTVTYDPVMQTWSDIVQITDKRDMERSISAAYWADDRLMLAYNKVHIIEGEGLNVFGQVDLCVYEYKIGADIAVVDGSIVLDDPNALPGDTVNLLATIVNVGDIAIADIPVAFYCGDTTDLENQIGQTQIVSGDMPAGSSVEVSVRWTIPLSDDPLNIIVVADPEFVIQDKDRSNNIAFTSMFEYDLALDNIVISKDTNGDFYITIDVANAGHHYIDKIINISAKCAKDKTRILTQRDIVPPGPYKIVSYTLVIESAKLHYGQNDVAIIVDETEKLIESSKLNNIRTITLRNSPAVDLNMDGKVDILDLLILSENWLIDSHRNIANISPMKEERIVNSFDFAVIAENWGRKFSSELRSDINNSGIVNLLDFAILAQYWASTDCTVDNNYCSGADINLSGQVDIEDLLILAENWLIETGANFN